MSAAFMVLLLVLVGGETWHRSAVVSAAVVVSGYVIFNILLKIRSPLACLDSDL